MPNASTTNLVLAALLHRLHENGWILADLDKLTDVYEEFQRRTGAILYGSSYGGRRDAVRRELEEDVADLVDRGWARRTVSRVQLIDPLGLAEASQYDLNEYFAKLEEIADEVFPPRSAP